MKWSDIGIKTLRQDPASAGLTSHALLVRAGFIKKLSTGLFSYGPFMVMAIQKFQNIIRRELDKIGCSEVLLPIAHPKKLWIKSGRWDLYEGLLQKMTNRYQQEFCLAPTHEEAICEYVKTDINSYRDMPFCLYQIQTKFRDEIRPRFGLMRAKEFIMKDAYSFDLDQKTAKLHYQKIKKAYQTIFSHLDVLFRIVKADSGEMGGDESEEFHILADKGEDELLLTKDFAANKEICPVFNLVQSKAECEKRWLNFKKEKKPEEFPTPDVKTIKQLSKALFIPANKLVKTLFLTCVFKEEESTTIRRNIAILLRGGDSLNLLKVQKDLKLAGLPEFLSDKEVKRLTGAFPGSCGPVGLSIPIYLDNSLADFSSFITGANKDYFHIKNVVPARDFPIAGLGDFRYAMPGDLGPQNQTLYSKRGIEVGHIFYLGDKYSKKMDVAFVNREGQKKYVQMGCYGIGVTRTIQAVIEQCHDKEGMIWPISISPFLVHICLLDPKDEQADKKAEQVYNTLLEKGWDVFMDDRDEKPGVKFKDADLFGFPLRIHIGSRDKENIELVERKSGKRKKIPLVEISKEICSFLNMA